jgi:hypothetical protein
LTGKIALIARGICTFSTKIRNAQNAGAVAVLVSNNVAGDGIGMAQDGTPNQPTVPAYNVSMTDSANLKLHNGESTTISATPAYLVTGNDDFMAGFSSQGPTDVDFRVKPDVVAPGVNVLSSIPVSFCGGVPCFAFFQGTSMATPHLAGSAAIVERERSCIGQGNVVGGDGRLIRRAILGHPDAISSGVVRNQHCNCAGVLRVADLLRERTCAASDQGDLACQTPG